MKNSIRLYLDEDVHPDLMSVLQKMGYDTVSTVSVGRRGNTDQEQIDFAISKNRTILTFNVKDFVLIYNKLYSSKINHPGIIVSTQLNFKDTLKRLLKLLNHRTVEDLENSIEFLNNWK